MVLSLHLAPVLPLLPSRLRQVGLHYSDSALVKNRQGAYPVQAQGAAAFSSQEREKVLQAVCMNMGCLKGRYTGSAAAGGCIAAGWDMRFVVPFHSHSHWRLR